jgi:hypothetical protein
MQVNTAIVSALMALRGVDSSTLASLAHVTRKDLSAWLSRTASEDDESIPFETQLEVLRLLGIHGETPRSDIVHYWRVRESLFSSVSSAYAALSLVLRAFGSAQVAYIAQETDPVFSFSAKAHFGLRFPTFMAILEVTAHPLRSISLNPETMPELTWMPDTMGILLPTEDYARLEPGAMKVRGLTQYLTYTEERAHWERLRDVAIEKGVRAEQVANLLMGSGLPALAASSPVAQAPVEDDELDISDAILARTRRAMSANPDKVQKEASVAPVASAPTETREPSPPPSFPPVKTLEDAKSPLNKSDDLSLFIRPVRQVSTAGAMPPGH